MPSDRDKAAKRLLFGGLNWLGDGAKTAAGYGAFDFRWDLPPKNPREVIREVIDSLSPGEFFWGCTTGLKLGNRVMVGEDGLLRRTDKKMKLSDQPLGSDPNSKFQIFVVV